MATSTAFDEDGLLRRARSRSRTEREAAFEELHRRLAHGLELVCRRMLGNEADAEDALQEAFLAIHGALPGFQGRARLSTWAYRIAVRVALQRRARLQARRPDALEQEACGAAAGTSCDEPDRRELAAVLDRAVASLPAEHRVVFSLCCVEELARKDVAAILGIPEGTVWTRLHRARKELAQKLAGWLEP